MRKAISSVNNQLIKETCELKLKKYRNVADAFIIEGARSTEEVLNSGWDIVYAFVDVSVDSGRVRTISDKLEAIGVTIFEVTPEVMQRLSDTDTPQGILLVVRKKTCELNDFNQKHEGLLLVLDEVRDPGNLGTMIRTADAAGIAGIILLDGCTDVFAPKAVRSAMGSLFHLPIINEQNKKEFISWCREHNWSLWSSSLEGGQSIYGEELTDRTAIVIGNEAEGVSAEVLSASEKRIYIPMPGNAESLNAAIAAGIILFECVRRKLVTKSIDVL
ncbi:MAG: TrmH family RNA methyltransferase [Acidaminococcaceae bacterium]